MNVLPDDLHILVTPLSLLLLAAQCLARAMLNEIYKVCIVDKKDVIVKFNLCILYIYIIFPIVNWNEFFFFVNNIFYRRII